MGTLIFPPREQTQVSYPGRRTLPPAPPGKSRGPAAQPRPQTLRQGADLRPKQEGDFLPARQQLSQREAATVRPMGSRHTAGSRLAPGALCLEQPSNPLSPLTELSLFCSLHLLVVHLRLLVLHSSSFLFSNKPTLLVTTGCFIIRASLQQLFQVFVR